MTREDIIKLAREAKLGIYDPRIGFFFYQEGVQGLERFAALVAAAKDAEHAKKLKNDIHSCGPTCTRYACVAVREAVEAEREACAKVCETHAPTTTPTYVSYAAAIRARKDNHD